MRALRLGHSAGCWLGCWLVLVAGAARAENPLVRFDTPLGSFELELCQTTSALCAGAAPNTVANFLSYVDDGDYADSFVHRSVPGFVIQGGTFTFLGDGMIGLVPTETPIANEFNQSNLRGTVAVPLSGSGGTPDPDSGTSGWFVNLTDNSALDADLFTVFGVVRPPGMTVVDEIAQLVIWDLGFAGLSAVPLIDYPGSGEIDNDLVTTAVVRLPEPAGGRALALAAVLALARARRRTRAASGRA